MVLPIAAIVVALFAFSYKQKNNSLTTSNNPSEKIKLQDISNPYPDTLIEVKFASPKKKSPSQQELNSWADAKIYGVWLDDHRINNNKLARHKPSDFVYYGVSKLEKNAINYGNYYYQVLLLTDKYYIKKYPTDSQTYYIRPRIKADTTKPQQSIDLRLRDTMSNKEDNLIILGDGIALKEKNGSMIYLHDVVLTMDGGKTSDTTTPRLIIINGKE